ncbi:LysM peptidoglycan-binding domain-containing protein [Chengkuizengella sediminis]|uniref:LysM peptidoglycan-binding domain-containing protein n=1 Tax=Chengkuizengella sediminis TaxID=1885917 RepID=UPI001389DAF6|nr:LysM peptidoglycan-binding domain-containing protein [Chengkuizengella sediminis]NDI34826.1 LysM peptidoglycan-binding domain-containing protein [Chengkuizengella sediminis]
MITHVIKEGENLWGISQKYGVPLQMIMKQNNLTSGIIYIGQSLMIPTMEQTHIVKSGDTLYDISQTYGISVKEIMDTNNLSSTVIYVGQKLIIPKKGEWYIVQSGDTLFAISSKYGVSVQEIVDANNLIDAGYIYVGQTLYIPVSSEPAEPSQPTEPPEVNVYIVKSGDSLNLISSQSNVPIDTLIKINNILDPDSIYIGQMLIVPIVPETGEYHIVVPGDTLTKIAEYHTVNRNELMRMNGLTDPNKIRVGQVLMLPPPVPA